MVCREAPLTGAFKRCSSNCCIFNTVLPCRAFPFRVSSLLSPLPLKHKGSSTKGTHRALLACGAGRRSFAFPAPSLPPEFFYTSAELLLLPHSRHLLCLMQPLACLGWVIPAGGGHLVLLPVQILDECSFQQSFSTLGFILCLH